MQSEKQSVYELCEKIDLVFKSAAFWNYYNRAIINHVYLVIEMKIYPLWWGLLKS